MITIHNAEGIEFSAETMEAITDQAADLNEIDLYLEHANGSLYDFKTKESGFLFGIDIETNEIDTWHITFSRNVGIATQDFPFLENNTPDLN